MQRAIFASRDWQQPQQDMCGFRESEGLAERRTDFQQPNRFVLRLLEPGHSRVRLDNWVQPSPELCVKISYTHFAGSASLQVSRQRAYHVDTQ